MRQPEQHLRYFGIQFGTLRSRGARTAHAALYNSLPALPSIAAAPQLAELARVAKVLEGLNTYAEDQLEELDYDRRLDAYAELPGLLPRLSANLALPLLCQCIHDVEMDDIALKHSASHAAGQLVAHAASQPAASGWAARSPASRSLASNRGHKGLMPSITSETMLCLPVS